MRVLSTLFLCSVAACSSSSKDGPADLGDMASVQDMATDGSVAVNTPTVESYGGPVLAHPKIHPVFFANDDAAVITTVSDFTSKIGASTYWSTATSEYGVGVATGEPAVTLTDSAPDTIDEAGIQAYVEAKLAAADPAFPSADGTLIALFYPASTSVYAMGTSGSQWCKASGFAFHAEFGRDLATGKPGIPVAVFPRCGAMSGLSADEMLTVAMSHEYIESATDPFVASNPAWGGIDVLHEEWAFAIHFTELADMCGVLGASEAGNMKAYGLDYTVTRSWSNTSALLGHDPCVPAAVGSYFNAIPILPDLIDVGGPKAEGVKVPVGQTRTIPLQIISDGATGPFTVSVADLTAQQGLGGLLSVSVSPLKGSPGDTLTLSINKISSGNDGAQIVGIVSTSATGAMNYRTALVGN